MKKANINGIELEYEGEGSGEPVLLISTGPIADSFLPLLSEKALVERYRLIRYRWEICRKVIQKRVPGGVAAALKGADNFFESYLPALQAWQFGPDQAAAISQPVLSVLGSETEQLFVDSHELLHTWFPQVADCRIEGVAHLLHVQRPEPVARGVAEFFARHPVDPPNTC